MDNNGYMPFASLLNVLIADPQVKQAYDSAIGKMPFTDAAVINQAVFKQTSSAADITTQKARIIIRNAADALQPQPPVDWLIEKLFSIGSLSIVVGNSGSKKTYSMLSAAVCVALGKKWIGLNTKQTRVLIVDEESGDRRLMRRLGAAIRGEIGSDKTPVDSICLARFNLRDAADIILLHHVIKTGGYELIVIDALVDVIPDADENSVKDIQPAFMALRDIADECQAAIVVIHHSNKTGGYRGSSAIRGAVDLMLMVDSKPESPNIDFDIEKARDIEPFSFAAVAHWTEDQFYLTESTSQKGQPSFSKSQNYVLEYLKEHGASSINEITANADTCSSNAARQAIYSLTGQKLIERVDTGGSGIKAIYDIAKPKI